MIKKVLKGKHKNSYLVRIQPRDRVTGKRVSFPVKYAATKKQAVALEKSMWSEYKQGLNLANGKAVFAEAFQRYVNQRAARLSPVTLRAWQGSANSFKAFFKKSKIEQITTSLVSQYAHDYVDKHHATVSKSSTIAKHLVHMRNFFQSIEGKAIA